MLLRTALTAPAETTEATASADNGAAAKHLFEAAETAAEPAAAPAEDITEHGEDVVHVHALAAEATEAACATRSCKSELVVLLTLLWVVEHVVGLSSLLELLLSLLVARVAVRVVFYGYLSIGLLYLVLRGALVNTKHLIVISFCHFSISSFNFQFLIVLLPLWHDV